MAFGKVYLVGAGPGDPGLITVRGREVLRRADVVLADRLVGRALLADAPPTAELIERPGRAELSQEEINALLVDRAREGKRVVRLKGGDPFVFGRGGEEIQALAAAGIPFEVVPGVTAAVAAPAYAGIPLTHRGLSGVVAFVTGHEGEPAGTPVDWDAVARSAGTLVLYMSVSRLPEITRRLIAAGRRPDEPAALVEHGTHPSQRTIVATLGELAARAAEAEIRPPALTIVGEVVTLRPQLAWFERAPLRGRRVLLLSSKAPEARAPGRGEDAAAAPVETDGAEVVTASPLLVVPRFAEVKRALTERGGLPRFRAVAFFSAHAVDALIGALLSLGQDLRALAGLRLAAVGEATARRLLDHHLRADWVGHGGGEALAAELIAAGFAGPVLVPRAAGGREEPLSALAAAELAPEAIDAYEVVPDQGRLAQLARAHREAPFDAIGFSSPRGSQAFLEALGRPLDGRTLAFAIGETTRRALERAGVVVAGVPLAPGAEALLALILDTLRASVAGGGVLADRGGME